MEHLQFVRARREEPDLTEKEEDELREEFDVLSIEPRYQLKILLSWGGPSDGYLLTFDGKTRDLIEGSYWYADWFTYAEESLSRDEAEMVSDLYLGRECTAFFPPMR